jgi:hypothetical protein
MNNSPKSNRSLSRPSKRTRTAPTVGIPLPNDDDNIGEEEIIVEDLVEDDDEEIILVCDNQIVQHFEDLMIKADADLARSRELLETVKAHEDLCAKTVKELKVIKKSYTNVCTYIYLMNVGTSVNGLEDAATVAAAAFSSIRTEKAGTGATSSSSSNA